MHSRKCVITSLFYFFVTIVTLLILNVSSDWKLIAYIEILFLIISIIYLKIAFDERVFSFGTVFLICVWIFHCGQIINHGLDLEGTNYLFFLKYGSEDSAYRAFIYLFISQFLLTLFIGIGRNKYNDHRVTEKQVPTYFPLLLLVVGLGPRLYYDFMYLNYGLLNGYSGAAVYIPQFVNTLAFFADIAVLLIILKIREKKTATLLFAIVLVYKSVMMMSGSRQEAFVFIIILSYLYFFIIRSVKRRKLILYVLLGYLALSFIMTIGEIRVSTFQSIGVVWNTFLKNLTGGFIGNMFGEFGSAYTTLVKTVKDTPSNVGYGYGLSYVAGIASVIPTFVNRIGILSNKTAYIVQYSGVASFGGSFLGEFYYNFGWFGLLAVPIIGSIVGKTSASIENLKHTNRITVDSVKTLIFAISLLLFVRGYFSDMAQKVVWSIIVVSVFSTYRERGVSKDDRI